MSSENLAAVIYLGMLLILVGSAMLVIGRRQIGKTIREGAVVALMFLVLAAGYQFWEGYQPGKGNSLPRLIQLDNASAVEVDVALDGHYYVTAELNGTPVEFVIDTGATDIVLARQDAVKIGLDLDRLSFSGRASTANGMVQTATTRVKTLSLGPFSDQDVRVSVNGGDLSTSLLGMAYLTRFSKVAIEDGKLILSR